jgi:hypothetical protein
MYRLRTILLLTLAIILFGCRTRRAIELPQADLSSTSDDVASIVAHTQSAENHVQSAIPYADSAGKIYLVAASQEHGLVLGSADQAQSSLRMAEQSVQSLNGSLAQQHTQYAQLESRWYVRWGRRIERALWIIGIGWLITGIAAVILGLGSPLGWGVKLGKELVRLVPMMNLFAWMRDWINARRTAPAEG